MKKFFSVLMAAVLLILPVSISACTSTTSETSDGDWIEIQSITYTTDTESKTLTSTYEWVYEGDTVGRDEFINAPSDKKFPYTLHGNIDSEKGNLPEDPSGYFEKTYYARFSQNDFNLFWLVTITDYKEHYVKVKLLSDGSMDLSYYENNITTTKRILPVSYEITYFND